MGKRRKLLSLVTLIFCVKCTEFQEQQVCTNACGVLSPRPTHRGVQTISYRTLKSLRKDHRQFLGHGKGKKGNATKFNNTVTSAVWHTSINHVCPPYLHVLLGIVKRHHDMLEKQCHSVDLEITDILANRREKVEHKIWLIHHQQAMQSYLSKGRLDRNRNWQLPQGSEELLKTKEIAVTEKQLSKLGKTKASFSVRTCRIKPGQSLTKTQHLCASLSQLFVYWEPLC